MHLWTASVREITMQETMLINVFIPANGVHEMFAYQSLSLSCRKSTLTFAGYHTRSPCSSSEHPNEKEMHNVYVDFFFICTLLFVTGVLSVAKYRLNCPKHQGIRNLVELSGSIYSLRTKAFPESFSHLRLLVNETKLWSIEQLVALIMVIQYSMVVPFFKFSRSIVNL